MNNVLPNWMSISGPSSTGKTTLFEGLRSHYHDNNEIYFIEESARNAIEEIKNWLIDSNYAYGDGLFEKYQINRSRFNYLFDERHPDNLDFVTIDNLLMSDEGSVLWVLSNMYEYFESIKNMIRIWNGQGLIISDRCHIDVLVYMIMNLMNNQDRLSEIIRDFLDENGSLYVPGKFAVTERDSRYPQVDGLRPVIYRTRKSLEESLFRMYYEIMPSRDVVILSPSLDDPENACPSRLEFLIELIDNYLEVN